MRFPSLFIRAILIVLVCLCICIVDGKTAIYRGTVYRGTTEADINEGGKTFSIHISVPAFSLHNHSTLVRLMTEILTSNVRLIDDQGNVLNSTVFWMGPKGPTTAMDGQGSHLSIWRGSLEAILKNSSISVTNEGRLISIVFPKLNQPWVLPDDVSILVVPCLPLSLFVGLAQTGVEDMPLNCLSGDPFLIHKHEFASIDHKRWHSSNQVFVTANPIEVPLDRTNRTKLDKSTMEHSLRVMEGVTCLHTRPAYVRGSLWDSHSQVYRFTPHRGGVQSLCYTPYPDTLPLLRIKMMDSYEVCGPEGVSTDPPQVRAELEFTGTIYGTNLTERDTVVITDELCTDFTSQNVFFVELFFSSSSRVSFFGTFHKRGIYHVCYHREGSSSYVRVSTLVVEKGTEVVIESDSASVLIDQDVKLLQSASVTRLKVQNKGNLDLKKRSLNVSSFLWSGGSITGKGLINCTGYAKITTQGYETRQLLVPIYNYGEMTIDVQRLSMEQEGAIHNYGNLTIAVSSMGEDGISSILSQSKRNAIYNYATNGFIRIVALDTRSYVLLTNRFVLTAGPTIIVGKVNMTDVSNGVKSTLITRPGALVSIYNAHLGGTVLLSDDSILNIMDGGALVSATVVGSGSLVVRGEETLLDSTTFSGGVKVQFGTPEGKSVSVMAYGTNSFGPSTYVHVLNARFVTSTGVAKLLIDGVFLSRFDTTSFKGNMVIQVSKVSLAYGISNRELSISDSKTSKASLASLLTPPDSVLYILDLSDLFTDPSSPDANVNRGSNASAMGVSNPSINEASNGCTNFFQVAEYFNLNGRILIRGCVSVPRGGSLNSEMSKFVNREDWEHIIRDACRSDLPYLPVFCALKEPPPPLYSGIQLGSEVYVRGSAHFELDELTLLSAKFRATDPLVMKMNNMIELDNESSFTFGEKVFIEAGQIRIYGGFLQIMEPEQSFIKGNVSVKNHGVLKIAGKNCEETLKIDGNLNVSVDGSIQCIHENVQHFTTEEKNTSLSIQIHPLGGLPPNIPCPSDLLSEVERKKRFFALFWLKSGYSLSPDIPTRKEMVLSTLVFIAVSVALFLTFLYLWGFTLPQWYEDFKQKPPLNLTLTWYELSYSSLNYVAFCAVTVMVVQNTMSAFHPATPAPLPLISILCIRSFNILMPHHVLTSRQANIICLVYLSCTAVSVFTGQNFHLKKHNSRRSQTSRLFLEALESASSVLLAFFTLFHSPISSFILDGISCSTLLRDLPSCSDFNNPTTFVLSLATLISSAVFVPWSIVSQQMRITRLDLRVKVSWVFLMHCIEVLNVAMWKVFYNNSLCLVLSNIFFHFVVRFMCYVSPPTAFSNINRFLNHLSILPFLTYICVVIQHVRAHYGLLSSCTDGELMFKISFAISAVILFVSFWNNVLYVRSTDESVGDANVDAIRRAIANIRARIADLKMEVFSSTDPVDRENTLNAIARLRIEFLEKQERYRYETHRIMRPFYLGRKFAEDEGTNRVDRPSLSLGEEDNPLNSLSFSSPTTSQAPNLLSVEEMETFSCGPALGKGSYGTVHLGILTNGRLVAVKYVNIVNESKDVLDSVKAEVDVLKELSHPNIIRYYGAHLIEDTMLVFMEFAVGGSLTSILRKFSELTEAVMQLYTFQILRGLRYLHTKGVVHRDIKGENILIDGFGVAKLADFGCSKSLANIANGSHLGCGTLVGSPFWMAPEVIRSEAYGTKADIWSVGCTVVEMLNRGEPPWREEFDNVYSAMFYVGSTNEIPQIPEETSDLCRDFLYRCFERDVAKRATADELLLHPWLSSVASLRREDSFSDTGSVHSDAASLHRMASGFVVGNGGQTERTPLPVTRDEQLSRASSDRAPSLSSANSSRHSLTNKLN